MSCLDVMYHQSYGAHYLPAAAYKATYYNHHHQQQQRKLSVYNKMQECMEQQQHGGGGGGRGGRSMLPRDQSLRQALPVPGTELGRGSSSESELKDSTEPAEAEYLSSRCVLFTYFQGDIGDVVDEHFSRALSQSSTFGIETKPIRVTQPSATGNAGLWKDGGSLSECQGSSPWNSSYPPQAGSGLPSVSVSVHPDFPSSPVSFNHPEGALWAGHVLSQASLSPADSWTYSLNPQSSSGYPNVHDVYHPHSHPHSHIHTRHHHPMLHTYPAHSPALDPRFSPLLLPGVRSQNQASSTSTGSPPLTEGVKTEIDASSSSPAGATSITWAPSALHGSLEAYDSAHDQTKPKTSVWF